MMPNRTCLILLLVLFSYESFCIEEKKNKVFTVHLKRVNVKEMRKKMMKTLLHAKANSKLKILKSKIHKNGKSISTKRASDKLMKKVFLEKRKFEERSEKNQLRFKGSELAKVELTNYADIQYWGQLGFKQEGGDKREFNVLFDTGSSWIWLPSADCISCSKFNVHSYYKSHPDNKPEGIYTIHYGKGSVEGDIIKDDFSIDNKSVKGQYFLEIKKMKDMPVLMFDGLIGLGPKHYLDEDVRREKATPPNKEKQVKSSTPNKEIKTESSPKIKGETVEMNLNDILSQVVNEEVYPEKIKKSKTNFVHKEDEHLSFLLNLKNKGVIDKMEFSVYLSSHEKHHKNSPRIIFGGDDPALMDGEWKFCDSDPRGEHWAAEFNSLEMKGSNDKEAKIVKKVSPVILIDSGTSMLTLPTKDFNSFMETLQTYDKDAKYNEDIHEVYLPNIHDSAGVPKLIYTICKNKFSLSADDYSYGGSEQNGKTTVRKGTYLKLSKLDLNQDITILGDPFFQKYFVKFDATENHRRIGIVKSIHPFMDKNKKEEEKFEAEVLDGTQTNDELGDHKLKVFLGGDDSELKTSSESESKRNLIK